MLRALWAGVLLACLPTIGVAQSRFFPDGPKFELPLASPRTTDITGRVIHISTNEDRFGPGLEAEAAVGEDFPVFALKRGPKPIALGFGVMVYGRYRLDDPKSSQISNDWTVGIHITGDFHPWDFTIRYYHESSHLGDEYAETFNATRLDWTRAVMDGWGGYSFGPWRASLGLSLVVINNPDLPKAGVSAGLDYHGRDFGFLGQRARPVGGLFAEAWALNDWRVSPAVKVGLGFHGIRGTAPEMRLSFISHWGVSDQRQFYNNTSNYYGMELQFDL